MSRRSLWHRFGGLVRTVKIWVLAVVLVVASVVLLWTGKDGYVLGQSYAAILGLVGVALALLNLPSPEQLRLLNNAKRAKAILDERTHSVGHDMEGK